MSMVDKPTHKKKTYWTALLALLLASPALVEPWLKVVPSEWTPRMVAIAATLAALAAVFARRGAVDAVERALGRNGEPRR